MDADVEPFLGTPFSLRWFKEDEWLIKGDNSMISMLQCCNDGSGITLFENQRSKI